MLENVSFLERKLREKDCEQLRATEKGERRNTGKEREDDEEWKEGLHQPPRQGKLSQLRGGELSHRVLKWRATVIWMQLARYKENKRQPTFAAVI